LAESAASDPWIAEYKIKIGVRHKMTRIRDWITRRRTVATNVNAEVTTDGTGGL
jgi:hypothetical protein